MTKIENKILMFWVSGNSFTYSYSYLSPSQQQELDTWLDAGYYIKSVSTSPMSTSYVIVTLLLERKVKNATVKQQNDKKTTDKTDTIHALAKELLNTFTDPELRQFLSELGIEN